MVKLSVSASSASANKRAAESSTLVVVVKKKGKSIVGSTTDKNLARRIAADDGLGMSEFKKGVFYRGLEIAGYRNVLAVGLDEKNSGTEGMRRFAAATYQALKTNKARNAFIAISSLATPGLKSDDALRSFTEGFLLASYEFKKFKSKSKDKDKEPENDGSEDYALTFIADSKSAEGTAKRALETGVTLAECINFSRDLGNTPGNLMTPSDLAQAAVSAAKGTKLQVTVWDKAQIKKEKFGGLLGVSLGSAAEPRFIVMKYSGGKKGQRPVCFVGKGLTFDSGGISIKPSAAMEEMKFDKCGGVNVIAAMVAIAKLKLKVNAIGLVPATENMPGPLANKPGDILVARNGKTVEVDNTDAEGRLILMDALAYASELKPSAIFDAATLTGAVVVALGNSYTGVFTRDEKLRKKLNEAAKTAGEDIWHMPISDHHVQDMKGTYADLNNISSFRGAGSSTAAAFLEQFVDKSIPWAHFDIAGTAWHLGNRLNYCPKKGASGVMVRTFVELAKMFG